MMVCPWATVTKTAGTALLACWRLRSVSAGRKLTFKLARTSVATTEAPVASSLRAAARVCAVSEALLRVLSLMPLLSSCCRMSPALLKTVATVPSSACRRYWRWASLSCGSSRLSWAERSGPVLDERRRSATLVASESIAWRCWMLTEPSNWSGTCVAAAARASSRRVWLSYRTERCETTSWLETSPARRLSRLGRKFWATTNAVASARIRVMAAGRRYGGQRLPAPMCPNRRSRANSRPRRRSCSIADELRCLIFSAGICSLRARRLRRASPPLPRRRDLLLALYAGLFVVLTPAHLGENTVLLDLLIEAT